MRSQEPCFVRGGLLVPSGKATVLQVGEELNAEVWPLDRERQILWFAWQPGTEYSLSADGGPTRTIRSPLLAAPYLVSSLALENADQAALAGTPPDAVVKFSPDGSLLALGTFGGWLRVVEAATGQVRHMSRIAEGMVKTLAWSPDGKRLYVGEQSPDGTLWSLDTTGDSWRRTWSVQLAKQVETSRPPANDRYGIYSLPAVYDLKVAADGRLFISAVHSWSVDGQPRNRTVMCCFDASGRRLWQLPREGAWPFNVTHFAIDALGERLAFLPNQSQRSTGDEPIRVDALTVVDALRGDVIGQCPLEPLKPHFTRVESWDSVTMSDDGRLAALGLADGRVFTFDLTDGAPKLHKQFDLATPVLAGNTPVTAPCSYARFLGTQLALQTQNSGVPFGSTQAANQAPALHRGANALTIVGRDGVAQWRYRGPFLLAGLWSDRPKVGDPGWLLTVCRDLPGAASAGQYGCLLFDSQRAGGGVQKLAYYYPTVGPASINADISSDGRLIALVEIPAPMPDGMSVEGTHRLHVVH